MLSKLLILIFRKDGFGFLIAVHDPDPSKIFESEPSSIQVCTVMLKYANYTKDMQMSIKGYLDLSYPQVVGVCVIHIQIYNQTGLVSSVMTKLHTEIEYKLHIFLQRGIL
jgi:hypothetical protein